jgi:hypothetical protein
LVIFRDDDVSANTSPGHLQDIYNIINDFPGEHQILSAVSIFSRHTDDGAVYPSAPFKDKPVPWFYDVDQCVGNLTITNVAAHGLFHVDHTKITRDAQEMSILASCNYLETRTFVPPFNRWNEDTQDICKENNISLVGPGEKWLSLEFNDFDPNHKLWYFHSWRYTAEEFRDVLWGKSLR